MRYLLFAQMILIGHVVFGQDQNIAASVQQYADEHRFNGTVLVQKGDSLLYHQSFGIADRRFNIPITNETVYKIASVTKAFTAVLILQLHEQGKLDLNKPFGAYLPRYQGQAGKRATIHQLLHHTSGMRLIDTVSSIDNALKYGIGFYQHPYTSDQILYNFCSDSLVNKPGEKFEYNNADYIVLGKIIEACYGKPYETVLKEKILTPLEMHHAGLLREQDIVKQLASTYFSKDGRDSLMNDLPVYIENWYAAGAMYASAADLLKFSNALFGLQLIGKSSLDLLLAPELDDYGCGVWVTKNDANNGQYNRMDRFGSIMGANAIWTRYLNTDITIIILSNTNMTDLGDFSFTIGKKLIDFSPAGEQ